jgi:transcription elongation factor Elf1
MTAEKTKQPDETKEKEPKAITFRCQHCDKEKLLEEMRVITRFFPLLVVCRECEKEIR